MSHSCNSLILREKTVYPYTLFSLIIREKTVYPYTLLMQTLNCIYNCNLGTTASQEGLHLEKKVYPYTLFFPYNKGKNCVPLHSFDITVHCFHEEESLLKGYMHYKFTYSLTRDQPQKCAKPFIIKWLKYNTFPSSAQLLQYGKVDREAHAVSFLT